MEINKLTQGLVDLYSQLTKKEKQSLHDSYGGDCATDFIKLVLIEIDELIPNKNLYDLF